MQAKNPRVKVRFNIKTPLLREGFGTEDESRGLSGIRFRYNNIFNVCTKCEKIWHKKSNCSFSPPQVYNLIGEGQRCWVRMGLVIHRDWGAGEYTRTN